MLYVFGLRRPPRLTDTLMTSRFLQAFSAALLALQVLLPWIHPDFHVQDGPAHVYTARALKEVLFHEGSSYRHLYFVNPTPAPNWANTVVFALAGSLVGHRYAEAFAYSLYVLLAYFCFAYAARTLLPRAPLFQPVLNCLVWPKYLFFGFFNFYIGVAGMVFAFAFFLRHGTEQGWRMYLRLGGLLLLLYFTHLVPALLAAGAILSAGAWMSMFPPGSARPASRSLRRLRPLLVLLLPVFALTAWFVHSSPKGIGAFALSPSGIADQLLRFPFEAFALAQRPFLDQKLPLAILLLLIALGFHSFIRKRDVSTAGLFLCLSVGFVLLSLVVPDAGLGGAWLKQRLGWLSVIFGVVGAAAVARPRPVVPLLQCAAGFLMAVTVVLMVHQAGRVAAGYVEFSRVEDRIQPGSTLMRISLPVPRFARRHDLDDLMYLPFQHAELLIALRRDCFALTDFQALLGFYPLVMAAPYPPKTRELLLLLADDPPLRPAAHVETLFRGLPELPQYLLVFAESEWSVQGVPFEAHPLGELERVISPRYEIVPAPETASFLRLYKRRQTD